VDEQLLDDAQIAAETIGDALSGQPKLSAVHAP
jgi:hypothetical protein